MRKAVLAARQELEGVEDSYRRLGWDTAIGASGTVRNVWQVLHDQAWATEAEDGSWTVQLLVR